MRKTLSIILVLAGLLFICSGISRAQGVDLLGVFFKLQGMRDAAIADIQRDEGEIHKCNATIGKCENMMSLARQKGNVEVEEIARTALTKARQARLANEELKKTAELKRKRAEVALANVRNLLSKSPGPNRKTNGFVTKYTGDVHIYKANGGNESLESGFLEPGDGVWTGDGSAEIQILGGRVTTKIGPHSRFVMKEYTSQEQIAELIKGKFYIAVDKIDEYAKKMKEEIDRHKSDPTLKDEVVGKMVDEYEKILDRYKKVKSGEYRDPSAFGTGILGMTPLFRTPCIAVAIRGTKFLVFENKTAGTEITVIEGTVDVKAIKGNESTSVDAGYRIWATKDGVISKPENIDPDEIERWWEK